MMKIGNLMPEIGRRDETMIIENSATFKEMRGLDRRENNLASEKASTQCSSLPTSFPPCSAAIYYSC